MMMTLCVIIGAGNKVMKDKLLSSSVLWPSGEGPVNRMSGGVW